MFKLEAPWQNYNKKIKALFELDNEIEVGDVYQVENGKDYAFDVVVQNHEKYLAQDIAREAFDDVAHGVYFCTADVRENDN